MAMYRSFSRELDFLPGHQQTLRAQTFDANGPGTILRDFDAFLSFFKARSLPVTGMHQLQRKVLPKLNALLAHPIPMGLKHPLQKSYPHVNGLYLLLRASGLTWIDTFAKMPVLVVDDAIYQLWQPLNSAERYCALLETWLLRAHPQIIGEGSRRVEAIPPTFEEWLYLFSRIPDEGWLAARDEQTGNVIHHFLDRHNVALLELFGLISVQPGQPGSGLGWQVASIHRTPLGDALLALLRVRFFDVEGFRKLLAKGQAYFGLLQPVLQPYFPACQNSLVIPQLAFRDGVYVFRVTFGKLWRQIAIPARQPASVLADAILDAFEFDHDHLYIFHYQSRFGLEERINHVYLEEPPRADRVLIGDVPLAVGQKMVFEYDLGDQWKFNVVLERIDPPAKSMKKPLVLASKGQAPQQY